VFGFSAPCQIDVFFRDGETREKTTIDVEEDKEKQEMYLFYDGETVEGEVRISPNPGKKVEFQSIRVEIMGQVTVTSDRTERMDFFSQEHTVASTAGEITSETVYPFQFTEVELPYESYIGINARVRYFLKVVVVRSFANINAEMELWVRKLYPEPEINTGIKMEVGIDGYLHIEFEYNKSKYHLHDVVLGKIFFLLVKIKIKHMEISLLRRESTGAVPNIYHENETLTRFEIMDGAPVYGESIPVRFFLSACALTPTYRSVNNRLSVRYYLNLVLVDEDDRRYFKQQEITIWRKTAKTHLPLLKTIQEKRDPDAKD
jgi:vacuolar protein sorting-associated protein 26